MTVPHRLAVVVALALAASGCLQPLGESETPTTPATTPGADADLTTDPGVAVQNASSPDPATASPETANSTTTTAPPTAQTALCRIERGRDVRKQTGTVDTEVRLPSQANAWAQPEDALRFAQPLQHAGFALLVEPRWEEAQAWVALGEPETNSNAGWQVPLSQDLNGSAFLDLVEGLHCIEVRNALAQVLPADMRVHLRTLRPGASYARMALSWEDQVPADGTWLLVKTSDASVTHLVLGGTDVDRPWEELSEWDLREDGAAFRWDFMTLGSDSICFDDATGSDHFARCGDPQTPWSFKAFSGRAAYNLESARAGLAAGLVPMAYCRGDPCTRWAERLQDVRVETTSDSATLSWKAVAGLPPAPYASYLDSESTLNHGKVFCYCWSDPTERDGRWWTTLSHLAADAELGFDLVHGNPATAFYSGTFRTGPADLNLTELRITGSATSVMFEFDATGMGPLRATGSWASTETAVHGSTSPSPMPQGHFHFGVWLTDEDVLPPGTYEAYVTLVDEHGGRIDSPRQFFTVP